MDEFTRRELSRQISGLHNPVLGGDELFLSTLQRLRTFCAAHGRAPEPAAPSVEENWLGRWVEAQLAEAHRGTLSGERRALLDEALGRGWALEAIKRG
ncbi:helicase associated domain-containing protein [Sinomonas sp. P47F7]|uniref:helicase associated domain-containing protein n=1 Tax=Sinomonas sp. P47F7 TaxID=3410987 RepID=UPI003BF5ADFC